MIFGSKNKGDWSELYVLLYLLGTGELYAADETLNRISKYYFPIRKIIRNEKKSSEVVFVLANSDKIEIYLNNNIVKTMSSKEFKNEADELLKDIRLGSGSFDIPHGEFFLNNILLERLAAPSNDITDIKLELHDFITGYDQIMGFSIKSYIGGAPTLLNASGATNFTYEIMNLTDNKVDYINTINTRTKIIDRITEIYKNGGKLVFCKMANDVFRNNLLMIDSRMEQILSEVLLYSYTTNEMDCRKIINQLEKTNPMNYPRKGIYTYKFKKFLCAKALGLDPSREWDGIDNANGGYIVVKSDGDVLAYHLYNRDKFEQYLLDNTKLERASTKRHNYAHIDRIKGKIYINLNLQIRFKD